MVDEDKLMILPPLIHGAAQWSVMTAITTGQTVVFGSVVDTMNAVLVPPPAAIESSTSRSVRIPTTPARRLGDVGPFDRSFRSSSSTAPA